MSVAMELDAAEPCLRPSSNGKHRPRIREVSALSPRRELVESLNILERAYLELEREGVSVADAVSRFPDLIAFVIKGQSIYAVDRTSEGRPCNLTRVSPESILDLGVNAADSLPVSDQHPHIFSEIEASAAAERESVDEINPMCPSKASLLLGSLAVMADDLEQNGPCFHKHDDTRCLAAIIREIGKSIERSKKSSVREWMTHLHDRSRVYPYYTAAVSLPNPSEIV